MDINTNFNKEVQSIENELIMIRRQLHKYPELSNQEYSTTEFIKNKLLEYGIEIEQSLSGTGVVGILKCNPNGRTIGVRADIDALPISEDTGLEYSSANDNIMHACGHDIHTTVVLGCARVLSKMKASLNGNIKFIFQPAEEIGTGAKYMIDSGVLENPKLDAIMGLHCWPEIPSGTIGVRNDALMASADLLKIRVYGKQAHAAHPHKGVDPIVITAQIINSLQTIVSREISPVDSVVITLGEIKGGTAQNIIPNLVELTGTVRTLNHKTRKEMPETINRIVKGVAQSMRGDAEVDYTFQTAPVISNPDMVELVAKSVKDTIGEDKLIYLKNPSMGTEDFGFYLEKIPGVFFRLGTCNTDFEEELPLHNSKLVFDEKAIGVGVTVMCNAVYEYLLMSNADTKMVEGGVIKTS